MPLGNLRVKTMTDTEKGQKLSGVTHQGTREHWVGEPHTGLSLVLMNMVEADRRKQEKDKWPSRVAYSRISIPPNMLCEGRGQEESKRFS